MRKLKSKILLGDIQGEALKGRRLAEAKVNRGQIYYFYKVKNEHKKAALAGGTTIVVDLVIPEDGETLKEAHDKWRRWAEAKVRSLRSNILPGDTPWEAL